MRVVIHATGLTATVLSLFAGTSLLAQTRVVLPMTQGTPSRLESATVEADNEPFVPPAPPKVKKPNLMRRIFGGGRKPPTTLTAGNATPVGIQVMMSDGSVQTFSIGQWLVFAPTSASCAPACPPGQGQLRGLFPTQYVNQIATIQPDESWKYTRPGRNVQVWRNGILQRQGPDYTLDQPGARIIPVPYPDGSGTPRKWNSDDYVTVAYLY